MQNLGANMVDGSKQQVIHGDPGNAYGDYITFTMGNMSFRLYNVYEQTNTNNENVNSIVTVMTNGNYTVVNLSDINTNNAAIDRTSEAIGKDFGAVDVVVAGHHGYAGSNTKTMFDELQPNYVVISNGSAQNSWLYTDCDLAAAIPYAQKLFGTLFYSTALSPYAIVTDLSGNQVYVYNLESNGALTDAFFKIIKSTKKTGWVSWVNTNETLWAYLQDGKPLTDTWKELNKKWYHFGADGLMQTGWISDEGGTRYCDSRGVMVTGWQFLNDGWYYFVPGIGCRATNTWWDVGGEWYCFDKHGHIRTGWIDGEEGTRYCDSRGVMVTGWKEIDGLWYYFVPGIGYRATNTWWDVDGKSYCFDENGHMRTGWISDEGGTRYCGENGAMLTRAQQIDGIWYYFAPGSGYRVTDTWWEIDGKDYCFDENGQARTGWISDENGTRYLDASGLPVTGWQMIDGCWYYFVLGSGYRVTGTWWNIDGKDYYFDENGQTEGKTSWISDEGGTRYCNENGQPVTGWMMIDGFWYYFDLGSGYRVTGTWWNIDGSNYYFDENGHMRTGWIEVDGAIFYLTDGGQMATGWKNIDGRDYFFYDSGVMARDTVIDGYTVGADGAWIP